VSKIGLSADGQLAGCMRLTYFRSLNAHYHLYGKAIWRSSPKCDRLVVDCVGIEEADRESEGEFDATLLRRRNGTKDS
jgi:hypothetical protein